MSAERSALNPNTKWVPIMRGNNASNLLLVGLLYLFLIIGLANHNGKPSQRSQWLFFIPIASICIYLTFFCSSSNPVLDFFATSPIPPLFFNSVDYLLLRKYTRELQPLGQKPLSEMPLKDRLWWASNLTRNPRGIRWIHEPTRYIPPHPPSTRRKFLLSRLMWMVFYVLQFDITNILVRANPCFASGGPSLIAFGWLWRSTVWLFVSLAYCSMSLLHIAYSVFSVGMGFSEPQDWPYLFGSLLDAYTLRNCWGRVWHQMLRKLVTDHSNFIAKQLHLPKNRFTSCFKLFISFFISGFIHHASEYTLHRKWAGYSIQFFLLQAVAITCEDIVISLALRAGFSSKPNPFFKFIGFIWVFAWFTYSLPLWLDKTIDGGLFEQGVKFSAILDLWHGDWSVGR